MNSNRALMREEVSKAEITSGTTLHGPSNAGLMNPQQAARFISYMTDNTAFLKDTRLEQMATYEKQLDTLLIGSRLIRRAVEAAAPTELADVNIKRKELRSVKVRLAADITTEFLEDNIEGQSAGDRVARELAQQFGNDLADLMLNGDSTATGTDATFLTIGDGIIKQAKNSTETHKYVYTAPTGNDDYKNKILPAILDLMPNKFKRDRANMRFYCSTKVSDAYILSIADRLTAFGDTTLVGGNLPRFLGIQLFPVEYMPDDVIILTQRLNLVSGVQRNIKVYSQFNQRKDLTEYTMYMRLDPGKIVWDDALVIAYI